MARRAAVVYESLGVDLLPQCVALEAASLRLRGMEGEAVEKYKQAYWLYNNLNKRKGCRSVWRRWLLSRLRVIEILLPISLGVCSTAYSIV